MLLLDVNVLLNAFRLPDAYLAALATKSGSELVTTDRDFGRFTGKRWRVPF